MKKNLICFILALLLIPITGLAGSIFDLSSGAMATLVILSIIIMFFTLGCIAHRIIKRQIEVEKEYEPKYREGYLGNTRYYNHRNDYVDYSGF